MSKEKKKTLSKDTFFRMLFNLYMDNYEEFNESGILVTPVMYNPETFESEMRVADTNTKKKFILSLTEIEDE